MENEVSFSPSPLVRRHQIYHLLSEFLFSLSLASFIILRAIFLFSSPLELQKELNMDGYSCSFCHFGLSSDHPDAQFLDL